MQFKGAPRLLCLTNIAYLKLLVNKIFQRLLSFFFPYSTKHSSIIATSFFTTPQDAHGIPVGRKQSLSMTKSELLKSKILEEYKSVRQFAVKLDIPYSTLSTALDNKIDGMAYGTVLKICEDLDLNPVDFMPLDSMDGVGRNIYSKKIHDKYKKLNKLGRKKLEEQLEDMIQLKKYTE